MTLQQMHELDEWIDAREAALVLGVTAGTLHRWAKKGQIPHVRFPSGRMRFHRADIEALLTPVVAAVPASHDASASPSVAEVSDLVTAV